jgi:hypothetical protein
VSIIRTDSFKDFRDLPENIKRRAERALRFFVDNPRHPSLRTKKMRGQREPEGRAIWEARVTQSYLWVLKTHGTDKPSDWRPCHHAARRS